jgi:hypothetical protein
MRSVWTTRPTSSIVSNIARCIEIAASRPARLATFFFVAANRAEHQPPLRPEAPKPAVSFSTIATRRDGSASIK